MRSEESGAIVCVYTERVAHMWCVYVCAHVYTHTHTLTCGHHAQVGVYIIHTYACVSDCGACT